MKRKSGPLLKYLLLLALPLFSGPSHALLWWWPWPSAPAPSNNETKIRAVNDTISATPSCRALGDFYWEIGDKNARLASGRIGTTYDANSLVNLASASKLPFAAYFVQRFGNPNSTQIQQLTMRSGYTNFIDSMCLVQTTVSGCFTAPSPLFPINNQPTPSEVGLFSYNGGHFQKLAVDAGLGSLTSAALQSDMRNRLGSDTGVTVRFPGAASGLRMSGNGYGILLRKIMSNQLTMGGLMGAHRTCTLPETCPTAVKSPVAPSDWDYSIGHWVEREPGGNAEAYSSIGLYGFYPWMTADKQVYGVISTENTLNLTVANNSKVCGKNMRQAWLTGIMQN